MLKKPSPLKHKEKTGQSHDALSSTEHWDIHKIVSEKPSFTRPKEEAALTEEEKFVGLKKENVVNYKGERITNQPKAAELTPQTDAEVAKDISYDPNVFHQSVKNFNEEIKTGKIKVSKPVVQEDTNILKLNNNGTPIAIERDLDSGRFPVAGQNTGVLPGSELDKKLMRINKISSGIEGIVKDEINNNKVKSTLVYDQKTEKNKKVLDYSDQKGVDQFNEDIISKYILNSDEFKAISKDVLNKNTVVLNKQSEKIESNIKQKYNLTNIQQELFEKYNVKGKQQEFWSNISQKYESLQQEKQQGISNSILSKLKEDVRNGKYEGYDNNDLEMLYQKMVEKEMEPIMMDINTKANEELASQMETVYDTIEAEYGDVVNAANTDFQNQYGQLQSDLVQQDPRFQELLGEVNNELAFYHKNNSDLYTVDSHTPGFVKSMQKGFDKYNVERVPIVGWLGNPQQIWKSLKGAKTSGMSFYNANLAKGAGLRHERLMNNMHLSQNQQWEEDETGYVNDHGDFIKWGKEEKEKYNVLKPHQVRNSMGNFPFAEYKEEAKWGPSRDHMQNMVAKNNDTMLDNMEKIFKRRKVEATYPKAELADLASGDFSMKELAMMMSEQTVNLVSAITTLGAAPAVIEGASVYETMIQDAARDKFGLKEDQEPTPKQLLEVLNDTKTHNKIANTTEFASVLIGGLEYVGAKQMVKPFFKNVISSGVPSLLRGQYKRVLKNAANQSVPTMLKGGLVESVTEGLQTGVSSISTGHFDSNEFIEAMGQGGIIGTMLPFGGNIVTQTGAELKSLYNIAAGKLNSESSEAYFNKEFKNAENEFKEGNIPKEEYDKKVEVITNARNANFKIPKEFKGKDRQKAVSQLVRKAELEKQIEGKDKSLTINERKEIEGIEISLQSQAEKKAIADQLEKNIKATEDIASRINYGVTTVRKEDGGTKKVVEIAKEAGIKEDVSENDGFVVPGTNKIIINHEVAQRQAAVSVGSHEVLHGILRSVLNDEKGNITSDGVEMVNNFLDQLVVSDPKAYNVIQNRINLNYRYNEDGSEKAFEEYAEEYFNSFHDGIIKGQIKPSGITLRGIGEALSGLFRKKGFNRIKFTESKNGQDVYDFLTDYSKDIQKAMKGKGAVRQEILDLATGETFGEQIAASKTTGISDTDADVVNKLYEEKGVDAAFDIAGPEGPYRGMAEAMFKRNLNLAVGISEDIASNLRNNKSDIINDLLYDPGTETTKARTVLGLVQDYPAYVARQKKKGEKVAPLAGFINNMLPERAKAIFGQYGVEMATTKSMTEESVAKEVAKIESRPQDVILTEEALEQYNLPLLDGIEFTTDQVDILQKTVSLIVGGKLPALDAAVSKNKSVSPLVAEMKKQLYIKNGPIHKVILDIIGKDKQTVEAFFKNTKVKKAMLDALTTTWLAKHLPIAVQKEVNGIGWTTDWKGRKKGTGNGNINFWRSTEEGPYKGMTDGKQKIRRNPDAMRDVTPAMLLSAFAKGTTMTEIKRGGLENISLALTQEVGLEVFKADMINDGPLKKLFVGRQDLFDRILDNNFVDEYVRQSERGTTKYRTKKQPITKKVQASASKALGDIMDKKAQYSAAVEAMGMMPIDIQTPEGRVEYLNFLVENIIPSLPKAALLAMSGTFTASASTAEKNWKMRFLFQNKEDFKDFLDQLEDAGVPFGINLTEKDAIDLTNAFKREGYTTVSKETQIKKVTDKDFKDSSDRGFRLFWEMMQEDMQNDQRTIPGYAFLLSSSSQYQGHFMRTGAKIDFYNTLTPFHNIISPKTGKLVKQALNVEEHTSPITALGKWFFFNAVRGTLFDGGKNSAFDNGVKSYFQGSLAKFHDKRLKLKGPDGKMIYDYTGMPPIELLQGILDGDISIWARYFHPNVNANFTLDRSAISDKDFANGEHEIGGINPNVYKLANGNTIAQEFGVGWYTSKITPEIATAQQGLIYRIAIGEKISPVKIKSVLNAAANSKVKTSQIKEGKVLNEAIKASRTTTESKGITVLDFDDTLATTKSLVKYTTPDGETGTLNAEQYANTYEDLLDQGYTFDFSDFNKVVQGKLAPLFNKALKLQNKFGPNNMFVLTARPQAAQKAIFDFLKANGLNIPIKNITGLGNSTAEAKALWIADKVGDGYNDFYFADDALQNVQAVKNMLDQFDVKSKVQQARVKASRSINENFNDILEDITGVESEKRFSAIKARKRGVDKGKFRFFIPPSHEDFVGLLYNFMGKGEQGNKHRDFFEQTLIRPLNRSYRELNAARQAIANDYKSLNKQFPDVKNKLTKKTPDGDFTNQDAIRVYLWNKHGHKVPGLSETDQAKLTEFVTKDPELQTYAETLNIISKQDNYVSPIESWEAGDIRTDLDDATGRIGREQFFTEFFENADVIFSQENLNKIEAAYGAGMVSALKDILYRIKTGKNRPSGQNQMVNQFLNYLNGSVASTMFFNVRSSVLQQMSIVNFINYGDNNMYAAAMAFANQKQYWSDWATIFNSDFMKQRRGGIMTDVNGAELAASVKGASNPIQATIKKLLELGFLPTQIGDNIAIATGGATFLRNRINTYLKQGMSQKEAEAKAFVDFEILAEATQQSARPDMVSQQQASPLGKVVLAFQNVTSQFNRLGKKAFLDLKNRRITPGNQTQLQSDMSNVSRIAYYFAIQNLIFYSLQSALFMAMFDDDKEDEKWLTKKERMINGSVDSVLRGAGVWGAVAATLKNMAIKWHEQRDKTYNKDESAVLMEMLNVSPPLGIKARKLVNAEKTLNYNKHIVKEMETFDIDNPMWSAVTNYIEATTNIPLNRLYNKTQNVRESLNNQHTALERGLMFSGWSKWNLGIGDSDKITKVKEKIKEDKKVVAKEKAKIRREEKKKEQEEANKAKIEENKKKSKKDGVCSAISRGGKRCNNSVVAGKSFCTVHEKVKQNETGKKSQCKKIKDNGKRCGMQTSSKSGYCYYHD